MINKCTSYHLVGQEGIGTFSLVILKLDKDNHQWSSVKSTPGITLVSLDGTSL